LRLTRNFAILICLALLGTGFAWSKSASTAHTNKQAPGKSVSSKKAVSSKKNPSASAKRKKARSKKGAWKRKGQQSIASERTIEIQQALIRVGYLKGEPSGSMDAATKQALVRFQTDNGWQNKVVPDARALIKLGLGPDHKNLLNPETAAIPAFANAASPSSSNQPE
jgi:peptidoglycan hydrolase-like protein with peptidoglycan-binding domain